MKEQKLTFSDREANRIKELHEQGDTLFVIASTIKDEFPRHRNRPHTQCIDAIEKVLSIKKVNYKKRKKYPREASTGGRIFH